MTAWLLDTCVIIDYLRDRPEAIAFVEDASARPAVSAITAAELFAGAQSATEQRRNRRPPPPAAGA
jgi:predicted nucleic acid-binding protein